MPSNVHQPVNSINIKGTTKFTKKLEGEMLNVLKFKTLHVIIFFTLKVFAGQVASLLQTVRKRKSGQGMGEDCPSNSGGEARYVR